MTTSDHTSSASPVLPKATGVRVIWCLTHRLPILMSGHCADYRKAEPDSDGWWSIDRSACKPKAMVAFDPMEAAS